jgi:hypothetical protein
MSQQAVTLALGVETQFVLLSNSLRLVFSLL